MSPDQVLTERIAETRACKHQISSPENGCVAILFDPANLGEGTSHPHLRKPPIQQDKVDRAVKVGLKARALAVCSNPEVEILDNDVYFLWDGGRAVETTLVKPFKDSAKLTCLENCSR